MPGPAANRAAVSTSGSTVEAKAGSDDDGRAVVSSDAEATEASAPVELVAVEFAGAEPDAGVLTPPRRAKMRLSKSDAASPTEGAGEAVAD